MTLLKDLKQNPHNSNKGTARGAIQLEESVKRLGFGRGIAVDKNGVIIAGNHAVQAALDAGITEAVVVKTRGRTVVVTQREDLDLQSDPRAVELSYADNRTSEVGFDMNVDQLAQDLKDGLDLSTYYRKDELEAILNDALDFEEKDDEGSNVVKLSFTPEELEEFNALVPRIAKKYSTKGTEAAVLEAMRKA